MKDPGKELYNQCQEYLDGVASSKAIEEAAKILLERLNKAIPRNMNSDEGVEIVSAMAKYGKLMFGMGWGAAHCKDRGFSPDKTREIIDNARRSIKPL